jgi:ribonuclease J
MRAPDELFVPIKQINDVPDRETLLLMTGSQGEPLAALSRISRGDHPQVKVKTTDTIIFSASPIPGNTISVVNTIDKLMMLGAKVVYGKGEGIHVSGHGFQEDQKLMLALTKPKFFVPVHGEHRMLVQHSKTGHSMGVPVNNTMIIQNGDVVELTPDSLRKGDPVKAGIELLDQSRNGIVDARVLKERQQLAVDGVVTILSAISTDGAMVAPPRVNLRGVVTTADARKMSLWTEREITWVLENRWKQLSRNTGDKAPEVDWMGVQREVEVGLSRRMRRELQVEPLILCLVQPAPGGTPTYKGRADAEPDDRPSSRNRAGGAGRGVVRRNGAAPAPVRTNGSTVVTASKTASVVISSDVSTSTAVATATAVAAPAVVAAPMATAAVATKVTPKAETTVESEQEIPVGRTRRRRSAAV